MARTLTAAWCTAVAWFCVVSAAGAQTQASRRQVPRAGDDIEYPVVLAMHQVVDDDQALTPRDPVIHVSEFQRALVWLRDNGIRTLTIDEYCQAVRMHQELRDAVLLTVDDGYESVYTELYPLLKRYRMHLSAFLITDRVGQVNQINPNQPWLRWDQCQEMSRSGFVDMEAHAARGHQQVKGRVAGAVQAGPWFTTRVWDPATRHLESQRDYEARVRQDLESARDAIERNVGRRPRAFCWPFGVTNDFALKCAREAGYEVTFTLEQRTSDPGCRRRHHFPDKAAPAFQALELHPERAAILYPPVAESVAPGPAGAEARGALPVAEARRPRAAGLWVYPVGTLVLSCVAASAVWAALYFLLFRHDPA